MTQALTTLAREVAELESRALRAAASRPPHLDYILVDGSASMQPNWWNFLTAVDVLLDDMRAASLDTHIIAHVFSSSDIALIQRDRPLRDCPSMAAHPLMSHFTTTPLYDAISVMGLRLQALAPASASILIVTDGQDNCSRTSVVQARAVLDWCRANGWAITFIGCDFNNSEQARELGVSAANAIGVAAAHLSDAAHAFATKRIHHAAHGSDIGFTDAERTQFGGYLNAPAK